MAKGSHVIVARGLEPEDIANTLLQKNLLVHCDRVVKIVQPGKKKLSSWPAHLEIYHDQVFSENDAFFAWAFVKRRPLWQTLLSFFWPVFNTSDLLVSCLSPLGQIAYTIHMCWSPPSHT